MKNEEDIMILLMKNETYESIIKLYPNLNWFGRSMIIIFWPAIFLFCIFESCSKYAFAIILFIIALIIIPLGLLFIVLPELVEKKFNLSNNMDRFFKGIFFK